MSRRRAPRDPFRILGDGTKAQRTGAAGLVYNAAPIPAVSAAEARALRSIGTVSDRTSQIDQFTLTADGAQALTLSFLPIADSWNVSLNGLLALNATDYSISGGTLSLLSAMDALTGDVVQAQYDYLTGLPSSVPSDPPPIRVHGIGSGLGSMPAGAVAGDFAVLFVGTPAGYAPTSLNGWTLATTATSVTHTTGYGTRTYEMRIYTKTLASSSDWVTWPVVGGLAPVYGVTVFTGSASMSAIQTATVANSATASTPTVSSGSAATLRFWMSLADDTTTINTPASGTVLDASAGWEIDVMMTLDTTTLGTVATTVPSPRVAGWNLATVGVSG